MDSPLNGVVQCYGAKQGVEDTESSVQNEILLFFIIVKALCPGGND